MQSTIFDRRAPAARASLALRGPRSVSWFVLTRRVAAAGALALLASCGGGSDSAGAPPADPGAGPSQPGAQTVGGTVSGLGALGLVVSNGTESLSIAADGSFTFPTPLAAGTTVTVQVASQPAWQQCTVANGDVTVGSTPVTSVAITCAGVAARFAYTAASFAWTVDMYRMDATTGRLTKNSPFAVAAGNTPAGIAADLQGRVVFAAGSGDDTVSAYRVDAATGLLTLVAGSPFAAPQQPKAMAVHPNGRFLYVAGQLSETVQAYAIGADGALGAVGAPLATGTNPQQARFTPDGRFLVVLDAGAGFSVYQADAQTGALAEVAGSPFAAGPVSAMAMHPNGKSLVAVDYVRTTDNLRTYAIDPATGAISYRAGSTLADPGGVAVHPGGTDVYVSTNGSDFRLYHYTLDPATGQLTATADAPVNFGSGSRALAVDPTGRYLEVLSGRVYGYAIAAGTRSLTPVSPANALGNPDAQDLVFVR